MPYPTSRIHRAWELFVALVAATKSAASNRSGLEKSAGRIPGAFFLENLAREAYIAADAFETVSRDRMPEGYGGAGSVANAALDVQTSAQPSEMPTDTESAQEMMEAFQKAGQAVVREKTDHDFGSET
ncbi:MAG: hypothetical protein JO015_14860 [Verrucomicrobia bacterium]|nr:hypothetical protein [Verrucomicrobiota bacterium]